jgi:hypothetical protein
MTGRILEVVGARGFEPPTPWSRTRCATRLRYAPTEGILFVALESNILGTAYHLELFIRRHSMEGSITRLERCNPTLPTARFPCRKM